MKKSNFKRKLKLKALQARANIKSTLAKPQPFTKEQFLSDCADNSLVVKGVRGVIYPAKFNIFLIDDAKPLAQIRKVSGEADYFLRVSKPALLIPCFDFLTPAIDRYFSRHSVALETDLDLFKRMCMSCAVIMLYWHEAAHVVCGHLDYQVKKGALPVPDWTEDPESFKAWFDPKAHPVLPERTQELDADIHGAQFALGHVLHTSEIFRKIRRETYLRAFAIGVRGLFEFLSWNLPHTTPPATATHPAAVTRAYIAITHAIARMDEMGVKPSDIPRLQQFTQGVLLDFEMNALGMTVNPDVLTAAQNTELELWRERHKEYVPYQPIAANLKAT